MRDTGKIGRSERPRPMMASWRVSVLMILEASDYVLYPLYTREERGLDAQSLDVEALGRKEENVLRFSTSDVGSFWHWRLDASCL